MLRPHGRHWSEMGRDILNRALVVVLGTILGQGVLLALNGFGVHPERVVAVVLRHAVSGLSDRAVLWIFSAVIGLLVLALWEAIGVEAHTKTAARWVARRMRRYIPLREATEIAHERTAGTAYAGMAEREAQNDSDLDSINRWFAWSIWHRVPIYGAVAPGKTIVRIPAEYQNRADFGGAAVELRLRGETTVYRDLRVKREDLEKYLHHVAEVLSDNPSLALH